MFTLAEENYLKAIYHLEKDSNTGVSTNSIAIKMNTQPSSVTDMVQKLAYKKVLSYQKYKGTSLTKKGKITAANVIRKHRLWEVFLVEKLNFQWDEVHVIAEQLEHIKSDELIKRLDTYLDHPDFDPHGDPIPDINGVIKPTEKKLLSELKKNQRGVCVGVKESSKQFLQYLDTRNIGIGTTIKVLDKEEFDDSMTIQIGDHQLQITDKIAHNLYINTH
ncbi:MAG: metal-dependent transcriptional regulator [Flavobacteriales bacterium]|jgi:DtxR family Mn-dependent transcriptional regulator|tara:strand:+ start:179 stop:835 length:657 start_codon:yes stop_codon:yes gene_type:complete